MKAEEEWIHLQAENQLLREQVEQRKEQGAQRDERIEQVLQRINALEKRLAKDSHNSSLPPSSDRFARQKKTRSVRQKSSKKAGGQAGHPGSTLQMSEKPEDVIRVPVTQCPQCQADVAPVAASSIECRQVVDVPLPRLQITAYQAEGKQCPHGQRTTRAAFPQGVTAPVH